MLPQRYIFALLANMCSITTLTMRNCLNLALVDIARQSQNCTELKQNELDGLYNSSQDEQKTIRSDIIKIKDVSELCGSEIQLTNGGAASVLAAFFWGMVISEALSGPIVDLFGGKLILLVVTIIIGSLSLLVPYLVQKSITLLIISQVVGGLAKGLTAPSFQTLLSRWEPSSERGQIATIIFTGSPLSSVISVIVTGYLAEYMSWKIPFYIFGSLAFVWAIPWVYFVYDSPADHPRISSSELELLSMKTEASKTRPKFKELPFRQILTCPAVWAMVAANTAYCLAFSFTATQLPILLDKVFHTSLGTNGLLNSLPYIMSFIVSYLVTFVLGKLRKSKTITNEMSSKIATSIALWGMAVCFGAVPLLGTSVEVTILLVTIGYALIGANMSGAWCNPLDIAPNFAATLMGLSGLFSYFASGLLPLLYSSIITDRSTMGGWSVAIYITVAIPAIANVLFLIWGSTNVQDWNYVSQTDDRSTKL